MNSHVTELAAHVERMSTGRESIEDFLGVPAMTEAERSRLRSVLLNLGAHLRVAIADDCGNGRTNLEDYYRDLGSVWSKAAEEAARVLCREPSDKEIESLSTAWWEEHKRLRDKRLSREQVA